MRFAGLLVCVGFLFSCSGPEEEYTTGHLPEIHLSYEVDLNAGDYAYGMLEWKDTAGTTHLKEQKIKLRYRGNRSLTFPKKNFSLKFAEKTGLLGLPKNQRWKLNAEYIDKTFMRNKVSYDLFRQFSPGNFAPEIRYCNVFLNGKYNGIYALTQSVDAHNLQLDKKDPKAILFKEPPICTPNEKHAEDQRKMRKYVRTSIRYDDYSVKAHNKLLQNCYYNQRYPELSKQDFYREIHRITDFIFESSDTTFTDSVQFSRFFDVENLLDWHLLLLVTNNGDGWYKNYYLSRKTGDAPYIFTPWDYDHSFGRDGDGEPSKIGFIDLTRMPLLHRLMETNAFGYRNRLYEKYKQLKKANVLTVEHIHDMIEENVAQLQPAMASNVKKWPLGKIAYFAAATFQSEVQLMKDWIEAHLPKVEAYLEKQQARKTPEKKEPVLLLPPELHRLQLQTSAVPPDWQLHMKDSTQH